MLLAEELALIAIDPRTGRHGLGERDQLNACLAGLLIAELALDDAPTDSPLLAAASEVLADKRGKVKAALSHMSRGLDQRLGTGTWDSVLDGLVRAGAVAPAESGPRPRSTVLDTASRERIIARLRAAGASDEPLDARTAVLLSMTGPAQLLELVAPERSSRKHVRRRIDHALDDTALDDVGDSVRRVLADAAAAAAAAASVAATGAVVSS
jgi:hypothetical protein